jgi:hypothetical protein
VFGRCRFALIGEFPPPAPRGDVQLRYAKEWKALCCPHRGPGWPHVTKRAEVEGLVQKAVDTHGKIDIVVKNAGIMPIAPLALLKSRRVGTHIDINIKGVLYGVAAALPNAEAEEWPLYQHCFSFRHQGIRARRHCLLRD